MTTTYLLVSHGSRDPRAQIASERLAFSVCQHLDSPRLLAESSSDRGLSPYSTVLLASPPPRVATAALECQERPLCEQIIDVARTALVEGCDRLVIFPLFLLAGVHVREDIPAELARAQQSLAGTIRLVLYPHLGSYRGLTQLLARQWGRFPKADRILISHGTRRSEGNRAIDRLAQSLGGSAAYWSVEPSLDDRAAAAIDRGATSIAILPYFLFAGGITDAIAQRVEQLRQQFTRVTWYLGEPLGTDPLLADLIAKGLTA